MRRLLALLTILPMAAIASTWYVNGTVGRDWYAGGVMMPKRTIQAAIDAASRGDHVVIAGTTFAATSGSLSVLFEDLPSSVRIARASDSFRFR